MGGGGRLGPPGGPIGCGAGWAGGGPWNPGRMGPGPCGGIGGEGCCCRGGGAGCPCGCGIDGCWWAGPPGGPMPGRWGWATAFVVAAPIDNAARDDARRRV